MVPFKDIYSRAINLFDDPTILRAYMEDTVKWEKIMYSYLQNGVNKFTNPTQIAFLLLEQTPPNGKLETFTGTGSNSFVLSTTPATDADFTYMIAGVYCDGSYNSATNTVTLSENVPSGTECSIEWYYPGDFTTDFSSAASRSVSKDVIKEKVIDILAHALVIAWAEAEKNFVLDIKNLLTDTDFKLYSNANSVRAKVEWVKQMNNDFDTLVNGFQWNLVSRKWHGGNFYG